MDVVIIFNGLGNQMSQYAFYLAKKKHVKSCKVIFSLRHRREHNGFELGRLFGIKVSLFWSLVYFLLTNSIFEKVFGSLYPYLGIRFINEERNYDYNPEYLNKGKFGINFYLGGWHSEKYFKSIAKEIKTVFSFKEEKDEEYLELLKRIKFNKNGVSLHVRRGDYLNISPNSYYQFGGVSTDEYYQKAIEYIKSYVKDPIFYIFSNDIEWCRENLKIEHSVFVTCNQGINSWRDMQLMAECSHHILANSTFSWWGAWLSKDNGITIHPKWFIRDVQTKDFYPHRWVCIE